jgi:hypothetical protein
MMVCNSCATGVGEENEMPSIVYEHNDHFSIDLTREQVEAWLRMEEDEFMCWLFNVDRLTLSAWKQAVSGENRCTATNKKGDACGYLPVYFSGPPSGFVIGRDDRCGYHGGAFPFCAGVK